MNHGDGALTGLSPEELRAAVRAVLRDVLPLGMVADDAGAAPPGGSSAQLSGHGGVVISTDADLTAFVRRVAALCEDPQQRAALQDGRHGFRLAHGVGPEPARGGSTGMGPAGPGAPLTRIDRGAVTERAVLRAAADGTRLLLGRGAVLTPLARDRARSLGVEIEKER
jgi:hypothetical protein